MANQKTGETALVLSSEFSGALRFYTRTTPVRWHCLKPGDFAVLVEHGRRQGYGIFILLFDSEAREAMAHAPGRWAFVGRVHNATLWRLES